MRLEALAVAILGAPVGAHSNEVNGRKASITKVQWVIQLFALWILSSLGVAQAQGPPSSANSQLPAFVTISPTGVCCFDVLVRDGSNQPVAGSVVVVSFSACTSITFCPNQ